MNETKFDIAKEIITRMKAIACSDGFDPNDPVIQNILFEEQEVNNYNVEMIDYVIKTYTPIIIDGGKNGTK